jgi:hypothetical protein
MSERFTSIVISGAPGYAARGHVSRADVIAQARAHYERQLAIADMALTAIRKGEIRVYHQTGLYRVRNRREITQ